MDVTLLQLRYFLAVARERHFARAAASLRVSPSTLSEQIAAFERAAGRRLFERTSRSVALTADGEELVPLAERAVSAAADVEHWAHGRPRVELVVGMMASSTSLRRILTAASTELEGVDLRVRPVGFTGGVPAVRAREVDCAIVSTVSSAEPPRGIRSVDLWTEGLVVGVPSGHALAQRDAVAPRELWGETLIAPAVVGGEREEEPAWGDWYRGIDPELPLRCPMSRAVTSVDETVELVAAGMGLNILGASARDLYARPGVALVPLRTDALARTVLLSRAEAPSPALAAFEALARRVSAAD